MTVIIDFMKNALNLPPYNNAILMVVEDVRIGFGGFRKSINPKSSGTTSTVLGFFILLRFCKTCSAGPEPEEYRAKSKSLIENYSNVKEHIGRTTEEKNPSNVTPDNLALERFARPLLPIAAIRHKGSGRFRIGRSSAHLVVWMLDVLGFLKCKDTQFKGVQGIGGIL